MNPAPPVTSSFTLGLFEVGVRVVAEHETGRARPGARTLDLDLATEERVGDAVHSTDLAVVEHHGVLDLGVDQLAVGGDRRVRADVRVDQARTGADDRGPAHDRSDELRAFFDDDAALDA